MKFDFIDPVPVSIERPKYWSISICLESQTNRFGLSKSLAERGELSLRPTCVFTDQCFPQHSIGLQQIVGFKRRRLIGYLIHQAVSLRRSIRALTLLALGTRSRPQYGSEGLAKSSTRCSLC